MRNVWIALAVWLAVGPAQAADPPVGDGSAPETGPDPAAAPADPPPRADRDRDAGFGFGGDDGGPGGPFYRADLYPRRPVSGQAAELGLVRQSLSVGAPLSIDRDAGHALIATFRLRHLLFDTAAVLPDTGRPFPDQLWNIGAGLTYAHKFAGGWAAGATVQLGSPSDKPFNGLREMTLGGVAFVRAPARREPDAWTFGLAYFPNAQVNFPLPVIAYDWNPTDRLRVGIGIPFSVRWRPADEWQVQVRWRPLTQVDARVTWSPAERASAFAAFEFTNEGYFLAGRADRRDTFFYFEKRLYGGVLVWPHRRVGAEVAGGYAFDRVAGNGRTRSDAERNGVSIGSAAFLSLAVRARF